MKKEWPYIAPRVEFALTGFDDDHVVFAFAQTTVKKTFYRKGIGATEDVLAARCLKCNTHIYPPERENLREHGRLHLAVDLAKRECQSVETAKR